MTPASFTSLLEMVRPLIIRQDTRWRQSIPADQRLMLTLSFDTGKIVAQQEVSVPPRVHLAAFTDIMADIGASMLLSCLQDLPLLLSQAREQPSEGMTKGINTGSIRRVDLLVYSEAHRRACQAPGPDAAERENSVGVGSKYCGGPRNV
ncbi:methionyl-tRNA formyltransferase, mitochondrial [Ixodes scapularis]